MPSMSFAVRPASFVAFKAASACSIGCDVLGILPISVVSAAPTTATVFCFIVLPFRGTELRKADLLIRFLEGHFEGHVEDERFRRLRAIDDVRHHARAFGEGDDRDRMRHLTEVGT